MGKATTFKDTRDTIDLFKDRFSKNVGTRQKNMWSSIFKVIKKLETDDIIPYIIVIMVPIIKKYNPF